MAKTNKTATAVPAVPQGYVPTLKKVYKEEIENIGKRKEG